MPQYVLHKAQRGQAPALVLLPGVNTGAWFFQHAAPLFPDYNLLCWNNPGVEGSPLAHMHTVADVARALLKVTQQEQMHSFSVLGHSMGGFVAQEVALQAPQAVARLILVATSAGQPDTARDLALFAQTTGMDWQKFNRTVHKDPTRALTLLFGDACLLQRPEVYSWYVQQRKQYAPGAEAAARHLAMGGMYSGTGRVQQIQCPTLVVHGVEDPLVTLQSGRNLAESIPRAEFLALPGVRHSPSLEDPQFWHSVRDFLAGIPVGEILHGATYGPLFWQKMQSWWRF